MLGYFLTFIFLADPDLFVLMNLYTIVPPNVHLSSQNVFPIFSAISPSLVPPGQEHGSGRPDISEEKGHYHNLPQN